MTRRAWVAVAVLLLAALAATGVWRAARAPAAALAALPGAPPFPPDVARRIRAALAARPAGEKPRTRHVDAAGAPRFTNRLVLEPSPYLLQHAHNPVNWYPWGEEPFARARAENKPVLLSVGYSTCHWCHVMEQESFEDEEIARWLNEHYVAIKVDRERRPDVDGVYMAAVQAMTGGGGWPMTVWLTPLRMPFYGATYVPPRDGDRGIRFGFLTLLQRLEAAFTQDPLRVATESEALARSLEPEPPAAGAALTDADLAAAADGAFARLRATFDAESGGFGGAPKFPRSVTLEFLLRYHRRTGNAEALDMVVRTLDAMARGGIRDHVGGGFHRYATDARWLVPHFEKMLYDNALLAVAYLEAWQATGREDFAGVTREILDWVAREMTAPDGGFWSATDADSEGEEGRFFVWTPDEIGAALGPERAARFGAYYGVVDGRTILHVAEPADVVARRFDTSPAALAEELARDREALRRVRAARVPPLRDEKVLVAWNGLMISAFARAAQALDERTYADRATKAAAFVLDRMRAGDRLRRSFFAGFADGIGYLDDYAFLGQALLDLYEATFDPRWLREAVALHATMVEHFADDRHGGFFTAPDDAEELLVREKPDYDGAEPSGNSVAVLSLLRLAALTTDDAWRRGADETLAALASVLRDAPTSVPKLLTAADFRIDTPKEIVIVRPSADASAEPLLARLRGTFLPNRVLAVAVEGADLAAQQAVVPLFEARTAIGGRATAYVCERRVCSLPTSDPDVFAAQLRARRKAS